VNRAVRWTRRYCHRPVSVSDFTPREGQMQKNRFFTARRVQIRETSSDSGVRDAATRAERLASVPKSTQRSIPCAIIGRRKFSSLWLKGCQRKMYRLRRIARYLTAAVREADMPVDDCSRARCEQSRGKDRSVYRL